MNKNFYNLLIKNLIKILPSFFLIYIFLIVILAVLDTFIATKKPRYESRFELEPISSNLPGIFNMDEISFTTIINKFKQDVFLSEISESNFKECLPNKKIVGNINKLKPNYNIFFETDHKITKECINSFEFFFINNSNIYLEEYIIHNQNAIKYLKESLDQNENINYIPQISTLLLKTNRKFYKLPKLNILILNDKKTFYSIKKNLVLPMIFSILISFFFFDRKKK
jgi:hypothetical protein